LLSGQKLRSGYGAIEQKMLYIGLGAFNIFEKNQLARRVLYDAPEVITMHTLRGFAGAVCALTTLCAACSPSDAGDGGGDRVNEEKSSIIAVNGMQLNGMQLNGMQLNGMQLNGMQLNGMQLNGVTLNGTVFSGTYVENNVEMPISGDDFAGVKMVGKLENKNTIDMSVESIVPGDDDEINYFIVSFDDGQPAPWPHICGYDENDDPIPAIPLAGRWNYATGAHVVDATMFTFACKGYAIAKCVEVGYKRWNSKSECMAGGTPCHSISLADVHQACTRTLTADYCGDGASHTVNGVLIDLWDNIGILPREGLPSPTFEAEWSPTGAVCIKNTRLGDAATYDYIQAHCPSKWQPTGDTCGGSSSTFFTANGYSTPINSRALIRNEF
jgi:hypothetical protein